MHVELLNTLEIPTIMPLTLSYFDKEKAQEIVERAHIRYIKSGRWRCEISPSGSHWWLVESDNSSMRCKYCDETRFL